MNTFPPLQILTRPANHAGLNPPPFATGRFRGYWRMAKALRPFVILFLACTREVCAAPRTSANYSISIESFGTTGAATASARYSIDGSTLGSISNGIDSSTNYANKGGYSGQQPNATALVLALTPATIGEGLARQLAATLSLDDATQTVLAGNAVSWSVLSGPISSISAGGLATAGTVYQDTAVSVQGIAGGFTASLSLSVLNVSNDDFGIYAADGIDDAWQVQYFGVNNPQAAPGADPDGDGLTNLFEFAAGLIPNDPQSRFIFTIASVSGQPMQRAVIFSPLVVGHSYTVQFKNSLTDATWQTLTGSNQSDAGSTRTVIDTSTAAQKFYRVQVSKP